MVVEIRRRLQDAKSVCVKRRHGAMPAWAMSAGEGSPEELAAAAAAPGAAVARGYQHALQSTRAYRQAEATLSQTGKKQEVWCTPHSARQAAGTPTDPPL